MTITESLDALRGEFSDCLTVAFADISTGMVLSASSQQHLNQEHLDALCLTAAEMLSGDTAQRISSVLGVEADAGIRQAIIFEVSEVGIFLKSANSSVDALCCACLPNIDLPMFLSAAQDKFDELETHLAKHG